MMQGIFVSPSVTFLQEMVEHNTQHNRSQLDLSVVPSSILEKIVHAMTMRSLTGSAAPRVDISVGPDTDYHHVVEGIACISSETANVFYHLGEFWYSACLTTNAPDDYELFIMKLFDNDSDQWEELDLEIEGEVRIIRQLANDALSYLGVSDQHVAA